MKKKCKSGKNNLCAGLVFIIFSVRIGRRQHGKYKHIYHFAKVMHWNLQARLTQTASCSCL